MSADDLPPRDVLWRMANAYQASQAIYVAATPGIADLLEAGPGAPKSLPRPRTRTFRASTGCCAPFPASLSSVGVFAERTMLVIQGGRERTTEKFPRLYDAAGFRLTGVTETDSPYDIIEGTPI